VQNTQDCTRAKLQKYAKDKLKLLTANFQKLLNQQMQINEIESLTKNSLGC
jgi:hypothetical protein